MDFKLSKADWERALKQSEEMLKDVEQMHKNARLTELAATMMLNHAKTELNQINDEEMQKMREADKEQKE